MHKLPVRILFSMFLALAFSSASANGSGPPSLPGNEKTCMRETTFAPAPLQMICGDSIIKSKSIDTLQLQLSKKEATLSASAPLPDEQKKKRLITAFCSFPFPLGFVGAHRVLLGTKPWIPVVYVATFGGCFGLLPLIDFCVLLKSKNPEQYENNPNIFMWMK